MRAYRLFNVIDVDQSGNVDLREIKRYMMSDIERLMEDSFDHPDCGIVWGLDEQHAVVIDHIEERSPAAKKVQLLPGLRLKSINGVEIPHKSGKAGLSKLHRVLLKVHDEPLFMVYYEPLFLFTPFSNIIDVEVEGERFIVDIQVGAIHEYETFEKRVKEAFIRAHASFKYVVVEVERKNTQVIIRSDIFPFKLLFHSGRSFQRSARYAMGFGDDDYGPSYEHRGAAMKANINLEVDEKSLNVLVDELFSLFDADGSGEFEFEEFRSFYLQLLDGEEAHQKLRDYTAYRFRDQEHEKKMLQLQEEDRVKRERRIQTRLRNDSIKAKQKEKDLANSYVDENGVRRRLIYAATDAGQAERKAIIAKHSLDGQMVGQGRIGLIDKGQVFFDEKMDAKLNALANMSEADRKRAEKRESDKARRRARAVAKHEKAQAVVRRAAEEKLATEKALEERENAFMYLEMAEVVRILSELASAAMRIKTDHHGLMQFDFRQDKVQSPALRMTGAVFGEKVTAKDIELDNLPPTKMNPGGQRYFFVRRDDSLDYDCTRLHPSFFFCDFQRNPSRHSSFALGAARIIDQDRRDGREWRNERGMPYEGQLWDIPEPKVNTYWLEAPKKNPTIGRIVIEDLNVFDLKAAHKIVRNSPVVVASAGRREFTSLSMRNAGANATWTDLNWEFPLKNSHALVLSIFSGVMPETRVHIGDFSLTSHTIVDTPSDIWGRGEILGPIMNGRTPVGQVRIKGRLDAGEPWDWVIAMYRRRELRRRNKKKELKAIRLEASMAQVEAQMRRLALPTLVPLTLPVKMTISSIYAFDMKAVHMFRVGPFGMNSPFVTLECGSWHAQTKPKFKAGQTAEWLNQTMEVVISSHLANFVCVVSSQASDGPVFIGRFFLKTPDLLKVPRDEYGVSELVGTLLAKDRMQVTGKVKIVCKIVNFDPDNSLEPTDEELKDSIDAMRSHSTTLEGGAREGGSDAGSFFSRESEHIIDDEEEGEEGKYFDELDDLSGESSRTFDLKKEKKRLRELGGKKSIFSSNAETQLSDDTTWDGGGKSMTTLSNDGSNFSAPDSSTIGQLTVSKSLAPLKFPLLVRVSMVEIFDLKAAHTFKRNSPYVQMQCGTKIVGTAAKKRAGDSATWDRLDWSIRVRDRAPVSFRVLSDGGTIIGRYEMLSIELTNILRTDKFGTFVHTVSLMSDKSLGFTGQLKISGRITEAGTRFQLPKPKVTPDSDTAALQARARGENQSVVESEAGDDDAQMNLDDESGHFDGPSEEELEAEKARHLESSISMDSLQVYSLPDEPRLTIPFVMRVLAIELHELVPLHGYFLVKNSPIVHLACGRFKGSTPVVRGAGDKASWSDIDWAFKVFTKYQLKLRAMSGSMSFGGFKVDAESLITIPRDMLGLTEVLGVLRDKVGRLMGKVRILCRLESSNVALESFVEQGLGSTSLKGENAPDSDSDESNDGLGLGLPPPELLDTVMREPRFGFILTLHRIALYNLPSAHAFSVNMPVVQVGCGAFQWKTLPRRDDGGDGGTEWVVDWTFGVRDDTKLRFDVFSYTTRVCSRIFELEELVPIPESVNGTRELMVAMQNNQGEATGKLCFTFTMSRDDPRRTRFDNVRSYDAPPVKYPSPVKDPIKNIDRTMEEARMERSRSLTVPSPPPPGESPLGALARWNIDTIDGGTVTQASLLSTNSGDPHSVSSAKVGQYVAKEGEQGVWVQSSAARQPSVLPLTLTVDGIELLDLKKIHSFGANSPKVILTCKGSDWMESTDVRRKAGSTANWNDLNMVIFLCAGSSLTVRVVSGYSTIGHAAIRAEDVAVLKKGPDGKCEAMMTLFKGSSATGKIRVLGRQERAGHTSSAQLGGPTLIENRLAYMQDPSQTSLELLTSGPPQASLLDMSGSSTLHDALGSGFRGSSLSAGDMLHEASSRSRRRRDDARERHAMRDIIARRFPSSLVQPVRAAVSFISCTDLRSSMTVGPNSPFVVMQCGAFKTVTDVVPRAGSHAIWTDLDDAGGFDFVLSADDTLIFTVLTGSTTVGKLEVSAHDILDTPPDSSGLREMFRGLVKSGRSTGNLRFHIILEELDVSLVQEEGERGVGDHSLVTGGQLEASTAVEDTNAFSSLQQGSENQHDKEEAGDTVVESLGDGGTLAVGGGDGGVYSSHSLSAQIRASLSDVVPIGATVKRRDEDLDYYSDDETRSDYTLSSAGPSEDDGRVDDGDRTEPDAGSAWSSRSSSHEHSRRDGSIFSDSSSFRSQSEGGRSSRWTRSTLSSNYSTRSTAESRWGDESETSDRTYADGSRTGDDAHSDYYSNYSPRSYYSKGPSTEASSASSVASCSGRPSRPKTSRSRDVSTDTEAPSMAPSAVTSVPSRAERASARPKTSRSTADTNNPGANETKGGKDPSKNGTNTGRSSVKTIAEELAEIQLRAQEAALNRGDLGTPPLHDAPRRNNDVAIAADESLFTHEQALEFDENGDIVPLPAADFIDISDVRDDGQPIDAPDPADVVLQLGAPVIVPYSEPIISEDAVTAHAGTMESEPQPIARVHEQGSLFDLIDSSLDNRDMIAHAVATRLVSLSVRRATRRQLRLLRVNQAAGEDKAQLMDVPWHFKIERSEIVRLFSKTQATQIIRIGTKRYLKEHHPEIAEELVQLTLARRRGIMASGVSEMASEIALRGAQDAREKEEDKIIDIYEAVDSVGTTLEGKTVESIDVNLHFSQQRRRKNVIMGRVDNDSRHSESISTEKFLAEGGKIETRSNQSEEAKKAARMNMLYKSRKVQAMVQCISFEGFNTGPIPERIFPARPYLHARVAGQELRPNAWIGETPPLWVAHSTLPGDQEEFSWPNLGFDRSNRGFPEMFKVRVFQDIIFEVLDGGSGLLVGSLRVGFDELMTQERTADNVATFFCDLKFSRNYGGGMSKGAIRFIVDTREEAFKLPPMPDDYWTKHQSQHWATYPIIPISTGIVRQQYREVAGEYDRMMIVNPVFFGFTVRFKGRAKYESHFFHPMFTGYQILRKPLSIKRMQEMELTAAKKLKPNPFKWDPDAARLGQCLVCLSGLPGCPRCFMLPRRRNGDETKPSDYEYDPKKDEEVARERAERHAKEVAEKELAEKMAKMKSEEDAYRKAKRRQKHIDAGEDDDETESGSESESSTGLTSIPDSTKNYDVRDEDLVMHTRLSTFTGIANWREEAPGITVYVKVMPGGYIKRLGVSNDCTTSHLLNMFQSHSCLGMKKNMKLLVPTSAGIFIIDDHMVEQNEKQIAMNTGYDPLLRYGLKTDGTSVTIMYFENFLPNTIPFVFQSFIKKNTLTTVPLLPLYEALRDLPDDVAGDDVQQILLEVMERQFRDQENRTFLMWHDRGKNYRSSHKAHMGAALEKKRKAKKIADEKRRQELRRIESQLERLPPEERAAAMQKLQERDEGKKGSVSQQALALAAKKELEYKERLAKLKERREQIKVAKAEEVAREKERKKRAKRIARITGGEGSFDDDDESEEDEEEEEEEDDEDSSSEESLLSDDSDSTAFSSGSDYTSTTSGSSVSTSDSDSDSDSDSSSDSDNSTTTSGSGYTSTTISTDTTTPSQFSSEASETPRSQASTVHSEDRSGLNSARSGYSSYTEQSGESWAMNTARSGYSDASGYSSYSEYSADSSGMSTARSDYTDATDATGYTDYSRRSGYSATTYASSGYDSRSEYSVGSVPTTARSDYTDASGFSARTEQSSRPGSSRMTTAHHGDREYGDVNDNDGNAGTDAKANDSWISRPEKLELFEQEPEPDVKKLRMQGKIALTGKTGDDKEEDSQHQQQQANANGEEEKEMSVEQMARKDLKDFDYIAFARTGGKDETDITDTGASYVIRNPDYPPLVSEDLISDRNSASGEHTARSLGSVKDTGHSRIVSFSPRREGDGDENEGGRGQVDSTSIAGSSGTFNNLRAGGHGSAWDDASQQQRHRDDPHNLSLDLRALDRSLAATQRTRSTAPLTASSRESASSSSRQSTFRSSVGASTDRSFASDTTGASVASSEYSRRQSASRSEASIPSQSQSPVQRLPRRGRRGVATRDILPGSGGLSPSEKEKLDDKVGNAGIGIDMASSRSTGSLGSSHGRSLGVSHGGGGGGGGLTPGRRPSQYRTGSSSFDARSESGSEHGSAISDASGGDGGWYTQRSDFSAASGRMAQARAQGMSARAELVSPREREKKGGTTRMPNAGGNLSGRRDMSSVSAAAQELPATASWVAKEQRQRSRADDFTSFNAAKEKR